MPQTKHLQQPLPEAAKPQRSKVYLTMLSLSLALSVAVVLIGALIARKHSLTGWERAVFNFINNWPDRYELIFKIVSIAKDSMIVAVVAVVIGFLVKQYRYVWKLSVATLAGYAIVFALKELINRPRPEGLISGAHLRWDDIGSGYPSGHTMMMTVFMLSLLPFISKRYRWVVAVPIVLMALSRVYLGAHAPLDVMGGFAVGAGLFSLYYLLPDSFLKRFRLEHDLRPTIEPSVPEPIPQPQKAVAPAPRAKKVSATKKATSQQARKAKPASKTSRPRSLQKAAATPPRRKPPASSGRPARPQKQTAAKQRGSVRHRKVQ